jgi:exopolysaccharide biosynthesis polyprenyl glycosylphosphotransferase
MTPSQIRILQNYKRLLLTFDFLGIAVIFLSAFSLRFNLDFRMALEQPLLAGIAIVNLASLYVFGAYEINAEISRFELFLRTLAAIICGFGVFVGFIYLSRTEISGLLGRGVFLTSFGAFLAFAFFLRILFGLRLQYLRESRWTWLAFGDLPIIERLAQDARKNSSLGQLETILVEEPDDFRLILNRLHEPWEGVIIATKMTLPEDVSTAFLNRRLNGLQVVSLTHIYEHFWGKLPVHFLEKQWLLTTEGFSITHNPVGLRVKRLMDIGLSLLLLLISWPILLLTVISIKMDSPGPVFFRQIRTGKNGKEFSIIKFRSMTIDAEKNGAQWAQKNDLRVTRVGRWIRLTRIDELPQIFNVLAGDMSFIGPRPERPEFNDKLEKQIPYYQLRHLLRPGITGWAQVMYPYGASVEDAIEKLQYELYYIKNYTVSLDLLIVLKTIKIVLFGKGR